MACEQTGSDAAPAAVTLASLVSSLTPGGLSGLLQNGLPLLHRATDPARFAALLDWPALRRLFADDVYPGRKLRVFRATTPVPPLFYLNRGRIDIGKLDGILADGASLIAVNLDRHVGALAALCSQARDTVVGDEIKAGAIVTTGSGGALTLHFDAEDLLILQVQGSKRWLIYPATATNPRRGMDIALPAAAPLLDTVLEPGDVLFLPAGHWHRCENGPELSLHLGLFFDPPTGLSVARQRVDALLNDDLFRVPLTRFADAADRHAHAERLRRRLAEIALALPFEDVVQAGRGKIVQDPGG